MIVNIILYFKTMREFVEKLCFLQSLITIFGTNITSNEREDDNKCRIGSASMYFCLVLLIQSVICRFFFNDC